MSTTNNGFIFMPDQFDIETKVYENGVIDHHTKDLLGHLVVETLNTKERHTKEALIKLGWQPPQSDADGEKLPTTWKDVNRNKRHLVAIVPDGGSSIVISKWWRKHKQRWEYVAEELWLVKYVIGGLK